MTKIVAPSIKINAFSCPNCGAFTSHTWFDCRAQLIKNKGLPFILTQTVFDEFIAANNAKPKEDRISDKKMNDLNRQLLSISKGCPAFDKNEESPYSFPLVNVNFSRCYSCEETAIWLNGKLLHPDTDASIQMNADMPEDVIPDFNEARKIAVHSPRGAAALLRLCIERICRKVTGSKKDLNGMISDLVASGLNPTIQESLDAVRVIGNNAVHPLEMDIRDDQDTALILFDLVNAIVDHLISHPQKVKQLYSRLPPKAVDKINERNAKATKSEQDSG